MALKNSQYEAIMRTYAARRTQHRNALEKRQKQIYQAIPQLSSLEDEMITLAAAQARSAIAGDREAQASQKQAWQALAQEKKKLLLAHGVSPSDLKLTFDCADCKDTGYIGNEKCHCLKQATIQYLYNQFHLPQVLEQENFQTFSYAYYEEQDLPAIQRAVTDVQLFVEDFHKEFRNLLFLGETGTGKTFLCNCIAKELMDRCFSVVYLTAFELFDLLANALFDRGENAAAYQQSYPYIFSCDLLIIDDLGTELNNSFVSSQLFLCINERILKRRATIISSNLGLEALRDAYSERTLSRITSCYTIWQLPGMDIRIKKKLLEHTL
ncbi:MAG: ATP-binding protein [Lachnospiraceae bacterium]|nr:ATP-binding protein [Lachnospiraceae bacterium]